MACFAAPLAEAIVVTAATRVIKKKEAAPSSESQNKTQIPFAEKLSWLNRMLWGGSALLCFEHIWHGEVVPFFPFLTAAQNAEDFAEMLHEVSIVGVSMAVLVTLVWGGMVAASNVMEKRPERLPQPVATK